MGANQGNSTIYIHIYSLLHAEYGLNTWECGYSCTAKTKINYYSDYHFAWSRITEDVVNSPLFSKDHSKAQSIAKYKQPNPKLQLHN